MVRPSGGAAGWYGYGLPSVTPRDFLPRPPVRCVDACTPLVATSTRRPRRLTEQSADYVADGGGAPPIGGSDDGSCSSGGDGCYRCWRTSSRS